MPEVGTEEITLEDLASGAEITEQTYLMTLEDTRTEAEAYEDYNPLYSDPEFAKHTELGSVVAPFYITLGEFVSPLRRIGKRIATNTVYSKSIRESFKPIYIGDVITKKFIVHEGYERRGKTFITWCIDWINQNSELVQRHLRTSYWVGTPQPLIKFDRSGKMEL